MQHDLALGIDLGGTQLRAALVQEGQVLRRAATLTDVAGGPVAIIDQIRQLIGQLCSPDEQAQLAGIGVSAPGPLDSETGTTLYIASLPSWEDVPLKQILSAEFALPIIVENDGIAAAYGEWQYGAGQGLRNLVYVTVSTGIGGGVVVDGRLLHGRRGMAAHVGHIYMSLDGPLDSGEVPVKFESFGSGTALTRRAREAAARAQNGWLTQFSSEVIDARQVMEGARQADALCLSLLREEARYLGMGFTSLLHLYSPDCLIMGGGVSQGFDLLEQEIRAVIVRDALPPFREVPLVCAALGDNAGLIGAAALVLAEGKER